VKLRSVFLFVVVLALSACGAKAKPQPPQRAAVPDVQGMNVTDAAVRLIKDRYCVRLEPGTRAANDSRSKPGKFPTTPVMRVEGQAPPAGSMPRRWSLVTLTVAGISKHAATSIDIWGGGATIPCPEIRATG
jgi:hypothetical protein